MEKLVLSWLQNIGTECPSQWEGETLDGRFVYVRYRHRELTVGVGPNEFDATFNKVFYTTWDDGRTGGYMTTEQMLQLTGITVSGEIRECL